MGTVRRLLLAALPKLLISRSTRALAHLPLPHGLRTPLFGLFARRYGADLSEMAGTPADYRNFAAFFQRELRDGARPLDNAPLVWPADGAVVATGPIHDGRLPQIKDVDYAVAELLAHDKLAAKLDGGSHATVYLAPGDYHRVHSPFAGEIVHRWHVPGGLYPVNAGAVASVPGLFARNERLVLEYEIHGRPAAVVMVAALNVADTVLTAKVPGRVERGEEIGRFGLGSTVVALLGPGEPSFPVVEPQQAVRVGQACR